MNLKGLSDRLSSDPRFDDIVSGRSISVSGLFGSSSAAFCAALYARMNAPVIVISQNAESVSRDIKAFLGADRSAFFPSWDTFPTEDISPSKELVGERLGLLDRILGGDRLIITATVRSLATRVIPKSELKKHTLYLRSGGTGITRDRLIEQLVKIGFKRRDIVGERGEFSARGYIVDIFSSDLQHPIRVEYIGDKIETLRSFDASDQRSIKSLDQAKIFPIHEIIMDDPAKYRDGIEARIPETYKEFSGLFDYFDSDAIVILDDPQILNLAFDKFIKETEDLRDGLSGKYCLDHDEFNRLISGNRSIIMTGTGGIVDFGFAPTDEFYGKLDSLAASIWKKSNDNSVYIISRQAERLHELLAENGLPSQKKEDVPSDLKQGLYILSGELGRGFTGNGIFVLTDREIFGDMPTKLRYTPKPSEGVSGKLLAQLSFGDHVVHSNYGIGIYRGLQKLEIGGAMQEYIQIDYAQEDRLYVPLHQMGFVEKYTAGGDSKPKIGRLGGAEWAKTKAKAKRSIKDMTQELLDLYVSRQHEKGYRYPGSSVWDMEFERSFPYEETMDQIKAINDIKKEMEAGILIDRLVCGDVGYGKTEVALRAAFKTIQSGQQVALLTPTTILADQHFRTFEQRMKSYPVTLEMLSRFRSKEEQKQIIRSLEAGAIDIIIGTHRLLSKDIKFKNLGLVIIDEEQKFGVSHKEKLKQMTKDVNVITLTATPIPRTLYMSLSGIKEMSIITTPPLDRSPVRTYLRQWDENVIKEAILRELERGGQVFFVHNYVKTIDKTAHFIRSIVGDARIAVAHGQMDEKTLEEIMIKFINKEYNVLVSTSIIESGLDIPAANTVIIDHAEDFGLSQLYQIRGRVGRSATRAFAYLLYHKENVLTDKALERLKAIQEFTALGSGYKLAMADLEIRGAGNILGAQQHGHLLNIGFDMYCDLLEESVRELKHIEPPVSKKVFIDLKIDAFIPQDYVPDDKQRIALYRRMNSLNDISEVNDLRSEMTDRFGKVPPELGSLFKVIELKVQAGKKDITSIIGGSEAVEIRFSIKKPVKINTKGITKDKWFRLVQDTIKDLPVK